MKEMEREWAWKYSCEEKFSKNCVVRKLIASKKNPTEHNEPFLLSTFSLRLRLESELQGEIGPLAEPVASEREDGLQQRQAGLEVCSDGFLHDAGQSE